MSAEQIINTKQLRGELAEIVRRVRGGDSFLVLHRSRPAFRLTPAEPAATPLPPLAEDPIILTGALGRAADGICSEDHDRTLYRA